MKKLIPILLIFVYLMSTTELYQIIKLPLLAEHFQEHKTLNQGTTFWDFLIMHYTNNDIEYADHDKDMRLPFKSHDNCPQTIILSFLPNTSTYIINKPFATALNEYKPQADISFNSTYLSHIWQPPKQV